jgi:imidazolonepropionase-like amidohydrolase
MILLLSAAVARADPNGGWVLQDVRIVDALGERTAQALVVDQGRIVHIGDADPSHAAWPRISAAGATVVPGLIDAHVHLSMTPGGAFLGLSREEEVALWRSHAAAYVASGVVAVLDTGSRIEDARVLKALADEGPSPVVRLLGPLLSPPGGYVHAVLPAFPPVPDVATLHAQLEAFDELDPIGVKVTFEDGMVRPIWPLLPDDVRAALAAQDRPLMVHAMEPHEYRAALALGVAAFVHPPDRPDDALIEALADIPVVTTLSAFDTLLTPAEPERLDDPLVRLVVPEVELHAAADPERVHASLEAVTRAILPRLPGFARGLAIRQMSRRGPIERRLGRMSASILALHRAGVELVAGSDSGNWPVFLWEFHGPTTLRELELIQAAGLSPADTIRIGTLNGARLLGLEEELGTIEVGKRASFVVVEGDPLQDVAALRDARWVVLDGERRAPQDWVRSDDAPLR